MTMLNAGNDPNILSISTQPDAHIFTIGPYGQYVSFQAQQIRALNTVSCLDKYNYFRRGDKAKEVAVIGGGLSGITLCVALAAVKAKTVLYESNDKVLELQKNATHRILHPNVNYWPYQPTSRTTELPFLNWFLDTVANTVNLLQQEWESNYSKCLHRENLQATVLDVKALKKDGKDKIEVVWKKTDDESGKAESYYYDMVFITSGFGAESDLDPEQDIVGYWEPDKVLEEREKGAGARHFIVSGSGDGGIIEVLRIAHKDFNNGDLTFKVCKLLSDRSCDSVMRIINAEANAKLFHKSGMVELEHKKISEYLQRAYFEAVEELPKEVLDLLHDSIKSTPFITLVSRFLPYPFALNSAPIHKLLLAFSLKEGNGRIEYKLGAVTRDNDSNTYVLKTEGENVILDREKYFLIVRHGSDPPITEILDNFDNEATRSKQLIHSNYNFDLSAERARPKYFTENVDGGNHPKFDPSSEEYHSKNGELLRKFCLKYYGFDQIPELSPKINGSGMSIKIPTKNRLLNEQLSRNTGGVDEHVFGMHLEFRDNDSVDPNSLLGSG